MNLDIDSGVKLAGFVLSIAAMIYTWFATRSTKVDQRFSDGSKRMDGLEKRIATTEQTITSLPRSDDFHRLEIALTEIGGDIKAMRVEREATNAVITRIDRVVSRHEDHLLDGKK